jgi:hypothetical protein
VAEGIGTGPGSTFGAGISGTWGAKTSDNRGLFVLNAMACLLVSGIVLRIDGITGPGLIGVCTVAGLGEGVTNTSSDTLLSSSPDLRLDGGVW